ncbi:MAG: hypothetical protein H7Z77_07035 [Chitinophagaceae bacterium]|nr:hypothetical protein [Polaromonas sp.]
MPWTSAQDLRTQTQKLWDRGTLLAEMVALTGEDSSLFPKRLRLLCPTTLELSTRFVEVRSWAEGLRVGSGHYRLVERDARSPVLGSNRIPDEAWLDTLQSALALIGRTKDAARFAEQVRITHIQPLLLAWLQKRPLAALELISVWPRLLNVVGWLQAHPRPGVYLRQANIAGMDTKFIESHRSVLTELFDLVLPPEAIDRSATGAFGFCQRYGFLDKPLRIRFRLLDVVCTDYGSDIAVTRSAFEQLNPPVNLIFITENEVNFLAFPPVPSAMVIFGGGFGGLDRLRNITWLNQRSVHYWGDIDTHGFAMLDQLRSYLPHVQSLMMDEATLIHHADHWGSEAQTQRDLPRLTSVEAAVYNTLRDNRLRAGVRFEQERVEFGWVQQALAGLQASVHV